MEDWETSLPVVLDTIKVTVKAFAEGHVKFEPVPADTRTGFIRQAPGFTPGRELGLVHVYTASTLGEFLGWLDADGGATKRLSRIDKDAKDARNKRIFELWLACHTQEEIAAQENVHKDTVSEICRKMAELPKSDQAVATHATDFEPPIYNIWKQQKKTAGSIPAWGISLGSGLGPHAGLLPST